MGDIRTEEFPNGWTLRVHTMKGGHADCTLIVTGEPDNVGCLSSAATNIDVETFRREVAELPSPEAMQAGAAWREAHPVPETFPNGSGSDTSKGVRPKRGPKLDTIDRLRRRAASRREARRAALGLPLPRKGR